MPKRALTAIVVVLGLAVAAGLLAGRLLGVGAASSGSPVPAVGSPAAVSYPSFQGSFRALTPQEERWMTGRTWHKGCPVPISELRLLSLSYVNFDGVVTTGRMVVNAKVATDVLGAFQVLYENRFPLEDVDTLDLYPPGAPPIDRRDVTVAFNCRDVAGTSTWSQHAFGTAVDINPMQNPQVKGGDVVPAAGIGYVDRSQGLQGMIHEGDVVDRAFSAIGWGWGGRWRSFKDYMHFSLRGT
jgi:hypothetical protein